MWNLELSRWWWGETIHAKQASPIKNGSYEGDTRWTGYGKVGLGKYRDHNCSNVWNHYSLLSHFLTSFCLLCKKILLRINGSLLHLQS